MKRCIVMSILFVLFVAASAHSRPFELLLLNSVKMHPDFTHGLSFDTYEDIQGVEFAPYIDLPIVFLNANNVPNIMTLAQGNAFFNSMSPYVIVSEVDNSADFINKYFFLDAGHYDREEEMWMDSLIGPGMGTFPYTYNHNLNTPHHRSFCLCISGGFQYMINPPRLYPNSNICDWGMCNCVPLRDAEGNIINRHPNRSRTNNLYTNVRARFFTNLQTANTYKENESGIGFSLNLHDRTPPRVQGAGNNFPTQEGDYAATTDDAYTLNGLVLVDNSSDVIGYLFTRGKISGQPASYWKNDEVWENERSGTIYEGNPINKEINLNKCHGVMSYSIFAWDEDGNVNRTESRIVEDSPRNAYGSNSGRNLGNTMRNAVEFDDRVSLTNNRPITANLNTFNCNNRRSEGYIRIIDNDLPNIAIRITSSKNQNEVFYFPPVSNDILVRNSTDYGLTDGISNSMEYAKFIAKSHNTMFRYDWLNDSVNAAPLYYRIMAAEGRVSVNTGDPGLPNSEAQRFSRLINSTSSFVRKNVRLEDYLETDTAKNNEVISSDINFGKRNGTGREMVAYMLMDEAFSVRIQEDVEYTIDMWMDDNVKWSNVDRNTVLDRVVSIPTGVVNASMRVCIPNQYPTYDKTINCDVKKAVNGDLKVVFREPTPNVKVTSESDLIDGKFPFIEATAEDYSGLKRTIRVYLKINDENTSIRTLDRKHKGR
jgi:hypothetical protein